MNQNPYLFEKLVEAKTQEIQREMQSARLLHEARRPKTSWLTRLVCAMLNPFIRNVGDQRGRRSMELQSYRSCRDEAAK